MTTWSSTASKERNCNLKPSVELRLVWFCYSITRCSFMCQLWSKEHDMQRQRGRQSPHHRAAPFRMLCCLWTLDLSGFYRFESTPSNGLKVVYTGSTVEHNLTCMVFGLFAAEDCQINCQFYILSRRYSCNDSSGLRLMRNLRQI